MLFFKVVALGRLSDALYPVTRLMVRILGTQILYEICDRSLIISDKGEVDIRSSDSGCIWSCRARSNCRHPCNNQPTYPLAHNASWDREGGQATCAGVRPEVSPSGQDCSSIGKPWFSLQESSRRADAAHRCRRDCSRAAIGGEEMPCLRCTRLGFVQGACALMPA